MSTNGTHITELGIEEEHRRPTPDNGPATRPLDRAHPTRPLDRTQAPGRPAYLHAPGELDETETGEPFALAPMVDRIAYGLAKGLTAAVKELERHIANETRKVGDALDRRLDALQASLQEVSRFADEQRSANIAVQDQLRQLAAEDASLREASASHATELHQLGSEAREFSASVSERFESTAASLRESDARYASGIETLRTETRDRAASAMQRIDELCREVGVHQEDIAALKGPLADVLTRVDSLVERMDRQADAFRSMNAAYSQRETELEQVMDGLARLRAYKTPLPTSGL